MSKYEKPELFEIEGFMEGVYAASGGTINEWGLDMRYGHHDSGSLTTVYCKVKNRSGKEYTGDVQIMFTPQNFQLAWLQVGDISNPLEANNIKAVPAGNMFYITFTGHWNPQYDDSVEFSFEIRKEDPTNEFGTGMRALEQKDDINVPVKLDYTFL